VTLSRAPTGQTLGSLVLTSYQPEAKKIREKKTRLFFELFAKYGFASVHADDGRFLPMARLCGRTRRRAGLLDAGARGGDLDPRDQHCDRTHFEDNSKNKPSLFFEILFALR
jgi:hypothetical protein